MPQVYDAGSVSALLCSDLEPSTLSLSLAALHIGHIGCTHGGRPPSGAKRKAAAACSTGHWGLSSDSALAVRLIAISRVVRSKDESILTTAAAAPTGVAFLSALRAARPRTPGSDSSAKC